MSTYSSISVFRSTAQPVPARSNESPILVRTRLPDLVSGEQDEDEELEYDRSDRDGEVVAVFDLFGLDGGGDDEEGGDEEFEVLVHRTRGSRPTELGFGGGEGGYEEELTRQLDEMRSTGVLLRCCCNSWFTEDFPAIAMAMLNTGWGSEFSRSRR
jgi:hypothetical protein